MERTTFTAATGTGDLTGWVAGDGPPVLAVHGGPGLGHEYLDGLVEELASRYRVATFQQRGLPPSTEQGDFTVAEAVTDLVAVLDHLGWATAYLMGHSWGGHLAFHAAAAIPGRLDGALAVDPLGAVGDGGAADFGATLRARVPEDVRARLDELDEKESAGALTLEDDLEALGILWPSYFADAQAAPPMPAVRMSMAAGDGLWADLVSRLQVLEASLSSITVPVGVLVGERSPMPPSAGTGTAARIPGAWSHVEPGVGHFVWIESPGCVLVAMDRLVAGRG
ncbi:alpha/beta fold hydrolase [Nocardioides terrigena]|uniref:alpha/beta fold hydrolase n=1 Tax=Nocardioides terrigena TaxID=424797 RepID=UPI000D3062D6|nr:alpha/beta hydrolase [Nocardioides terrigena]